MRVCFFGAYDPAYPRNRILRVGLARAGHEVIEARAHERRAFRRFPALLAAFAKVGAGADVIFVPEFRHKDVPLARAIAGRRPLVFDPLVSRVDTLVEDWGLHAPGSGQARWNGWIDRVSLGWSDRVLCDTWAHGRLFASLGVPTARLRRVPVGAEDAFFRVPARRPNAEVRIVYLGGFLPLHGMLEVVAALGVLERSGVAFRAVLAGRGIEWEACRRQVEVLGLTRVELPGALPYSEAPEFLGAGDVVLGAFGAGEKAGRVVPHKVWQGLAAGRAVVTGEGDGVREWFTPGMHLETAQRGEPESLAAVLAHLIAEPDRRRALAESGRERALEVGTPDRVVAELVPVLEESLR